jgi:hypothetical protein
VLTPGWRPYNNKQLRLFKTNAFEVMNDAVCWVSFGMKSMDEALVLKQFALQEQTSRSHLRLVLILQGLAQGDTTHGITREAPISRMVKDTVINKSAAMAKIVLRRQSNSIAGLI